MEISETTENNIINNDKSKLNEMPKYSVVLRFWNTPQEIEVVDYVGSINNITKQGYINFIDSSGRLWKVPESDFILIKNFPDKIDIEDFQRLKKEVEEMNKKLEKKEKPVYNEVG